MFGKFIRGFSISLSSADASDSETVGMFLALKHRNLDVFQHAFNVASDPDSLRFRLWLSHEDILDMISPPVEDSEMVVNWVRSTCKSGVRTLENRRDTIRVETSVACAKQLFPTIRLASFLHTRSRTQVVRLHPESMPAEAPTHLAEIVDLVIGLDMLPVVRKVKQRSMSDTSLYSYIYPGDWNRVYNIETNKITQAGATQGVIEFPPAGGPLWEDWQLYDKLSNVPFSNFSEIIGNFTLGNDSESLLDIQLISAVAHTPTAYITIADSWAYGMAQELFNQGASAIRVASVSYGWPEALTCQSEVRVFES